MKRLFGFWTLLGVSLLLSKTGCGRPAPKAPELDPPAMAAKAIELYDSNGNKKIDGDEFTQTPGLEFARREIDEDKDKALSADEIQKRLEAWKASGITLTSAQIVCRVNGKQVKEGTLRLVPDPFLGENFLPAEGEFINGTCQPAAPNPGNYQALPLGFYSVELSSPQGNFEPGKMGVEIFDESRHFIKNRRYEIYED
ncbi:MAG: hypothetical protein IJF17_04295 [Thermoguttaceae bacterium]|nr:hypothetical protein [Thermoguttaceae bacterium]